jgi:hypothetical protein
MQRCPCVTDQTAHAEGGTTRAVGMAAEPHGQTWLRVRLGLHPLISLGGLHLASWRGAGGDEVPVGFDGCQPEAGGLALGPPCAAAWLAAQAAFTHLALL